jgi:hypothetical protein
MRPLLRLALAASLAAAIGAATWLLLDGRTSRDEMQAYRGREAPAPPAPLRPHEAERRESAPAPPPLTTGAPAPRPRAVAEATLLLSLATLRSGGSVPRLALPPGVERVRLEVDLGTTADEPVTHVAYTAVLRDATGDEIWRGERLTADGDGVLRLAVPAAALAPGRYELTVQGLTAGGEVEDLGFPELEVIRP